MACQFTNDEVIELQSLVDRRIHAAEASAAVGSHSNQALMQDEIDMLMVIQDILETAEGGSCVFDLVQINELLGLIAVRMAAAAANRNGAGSHSNMALMDEEIDLLESIQGKLEAAAATAAAPALAVANNNAAAVNAVVAVNAAANANANAAIANVAAVNAVVQAAAAENAAGNAAVSYSNNFHPLGGRRRRHARKTRKARKGRKGTRRGRKGTRRGRKGTRRA